MPHLVYIPAKGTAKLAREADLDGVTVVDSIDDEQLADVEVFVPVSLSRDEAVALMARMPRLRLVQLGSAGVEDWVGRVPAGVVLAAARGAHGRATAEWAVAALLAVLRDFPAFVDAQRDHRWIPHATQGLAGLRVLVIGAGDLGKHTRRRLLGFDAEVTMVGRGARDGVHGVDELPDLLPDHGAVILVLPLTQQSEKLVDAAFLAAMPDRAVLVNAARGRVVHTDALLAELQGGRLRAALDVTDPEPLPPEHPLWSAPNLLLTPHVGGAVEGFAERTADIVVDQLRRFVAGDPVKHVIGPAGY